MCLLESISWIENAFAKHLPCRMPIEMRLIVPALENCATATQRKAVINRQRRRVEHVCATGRVRLDTKDGSKFILQPILDFFGEIKKHRTLPFNTLHK